MKSSIFLLMLMFAVYLLMDIPSIFLVLFGVLLVLKFTVLYFIKERRRKSALESKQ